MTKFLIFLFVLCILSFASAERYLGGVFYPSYEYPNNGIAWFNTCEAAADDIDIYPIFVDFDYTPLDVASSTYLYNSSSITNADFHFGDFADADWELIEAESTAQFIFGDLSGFNIIARQGDENSGVIELRINTFLWEIFEIAPFSNSLIASGYFFNCEQGSNSENTAPGCPINVCNNDCALAGTCLL